MKRHLFGAIAVGLTVTLGMTGCGKGSSTDSGDDGGGKTIKFVAAKYDEDTQGYWKKLIKDFEAKNPGYTVNLEIVDWSQMDKKIQTYIQTKQVPDVLNYNAFSDYARDGLIYKASEIVSPEVLKDFLPVFTDHAKYKGTQYGLPFIASARLFFYNKKIFKKAGITEPPTTWADVKADAKKIKKKVPDVEPIGIPLGPEEAQAEFYIWAMNNGGGWVDSSGKWAIDQQANIDTLKYLRGLTEAGLTQPNPETTDRKDVFNQFSQGKIGMLNGGVFQRKGFIDPVNPDLPYGISQLPSKDGTTHKTLGVEDFLMAFKKDDGKNKAAVKKFLDFFYQAKNSSKFLKLEGFLPVTKSAGDALSSDPYYKPFVQALPNAQFAPTGKAGWNAVADAVKQHIGTAVAGSTPKAVLKNLQETAEKKS